MEWTFGAPRPDSPRFDASLYKTWAHTTEHLSTSRLTCLCTGHPPRLAHASAGSFASSVPWHGHTHTYTHQRVAAGRSTFAQLGCLVSLVLTLKTASNRTLCWIRRATHTGAGALSRANRRYSSPWPHIAYTPPPLCQHCSQGAWTPRILDHLNSHLNERVCVSSGAAKEPGRWPSTQGQVPCSRASGHRTSADRARGWRRGQVRLNELSQHAQKPVANRTMGRLGLIILHPLVYVAGALASSCPMLRRTRTASTISTMCLGWRARSL